MIAANSRSLSDSPEGWPVLRLEDWNVPLYVSPHGLTTSLIPYGNRHFDIEFDFLSDQLIIRTSVHGPQP
jgi:hypothetical protein